MSEEKPTFKITDRRLFNSDGTPRDIEREAEAITDTATPIIETMNATSTAAAQTSTTPPSTSSPTQTAPPIEEPTDEMTEELNADSTPFVNLLMFVASPAAAALGMTEHPSLPPGEVDLPLAKHCIDLLATLREKTRGNLSAQEQQVFEGLLAELRMQFVSLTNAPRNSSRGGQNFGGGFSGGDITGGR